MKHVLLFMSLLSFACRDDQKREASTDINPASSAPVVAGKIEIPIKAPEVLANMSQTHANIEVESDEDRSLNFSVALPKTWLQRKAPANIRQALFPGRALATFAPEPKAGGAVAVVAVLTPITHEIPIDVWARATFEQEGYTVVDARWFPGPSGLFFDITGRRNDPSGEVVRRSSVRQDGGRIFSLNTISPVGQWNAVMQEFWVAHVTFELLHARAGTVEERQTIIARSPAFRVEYPASWKAEAETSRDRRVSGVHIRLRTPDDKDPTAYLLIRAEVAPESGGDVLLEQALKVVAKAGITVHGQPQAVSEHEDPRSIAVQGWIGGYSAPARMGNADITLKVGFVRRGELNFLFVLCSPTSSTDLLAALRAQRTLEIARASLEVPTKAR